MQRIISNSNLSNLRLGLPVSNDIATLLARNTSITHLRIAHPGLSTAAFASLSANTTATYIRTTDSANARHPVAAINLDRMLQRRDDLVRVVVLLSLHRAANSQHHSLWKTLPRDLLIPVLVVSCGITSPASVVYIGKTHKQLSSLVAFVVDRADDLQAAFVRGKQVERAVPYCARSNWSCDVVMY